LDQPRQKNFVKPYLKGKRLAVVTPTCHPSDGRKHKTGESWSREDLVKSEMLFSNYPEQNG
jgi:hypothetical protein